jgi:hypothetical protein
VLRPAAELDPNELCVLVEGTIAPEDMPSNAVVEATPEEPSVAEHPANDQPMVAPHTVTNDAARSTDLASICPHRDGARAPSFAPERLAAVGESE